MPNDNERIVNSTTKKKEKGKCNYHQEINDRLVAANISWPVALMKH